MKEIAKQIAKDYPITLCDGKQPIGKAWQTRRYSPEDIETAFAANPDLNLGIIMGPESGLMDSEWDDAQEKADFDRLCEGVEMPRTPQFQSRRGGHVFWQYEPRLGELGRGTVSFGKLKIRVGGGGKAIQSLIPPSTTNNHTREWIVPLDVPPAKMPEIMVGRILAAQNPNVDKEALKSMLAVDVKDGGNDSSKRLLVVCIRAVEHNLGDEQALATIREYANERPFLKAWSDAEILQRVREAEARSDVHRGSRVTLSNFRVVTRDEKEARVALPMREIIDAINQHTGNWPRRVGNTLFIDDPSHGIAWFDRRGAASLTGWLKESANVKWATGGNFVSAAELFAELERTAPQYDAIELLPHEPPLPNIYYRGSAPPMGDGSRLAELLKRFRPETTIDRDLIQAGMMTAFWGGPPGCRPMFVVTSDDGRGVGKSKIPEIVGNFCGGVIDVSTGDSISTIKERLLSPEGMTKRLLLLDNVKSLRLSWGELEALITSPVISGKRMYVGEGQRPNLLNFWMTLNGISLGDDLAKRSVIIKVVRGDNSGTWYEDILRFIDEHRPQIIGDIIAALRAEPNKLTAYTRWSTWEEHVLSRLPNPDDAQRLIMERQEEANAEHEEAAIIQDHFAYVLSLYAYDPQTAIVRIPSRKVVEWFNAATGGKHSTTAVSRKLTQLTNEGQLRCLAKDPSHTYGRCFIWTGPDADAFGDIDNQIVKGEIEVREVA